jgi:hypothetical protein
MIAPKLHPYQKQILEGAEEGPRCYLFWRRSRSSLLSPAGTLTVEQARELVEKFLAKHSDVVQVWRSKA